MAAGTSIEILDLRHFAAPVLRPVLEAEAELWKQRLHWDYNVSARLLLQYLDSHTLPGYAALEEGKVTGYVFCVYEECKAIIGDVFALAGAGRRGGPGGPVAADSDRAPENPAHQPAHQVEETLLRHLLELLLNSPQVDRVESQLLLHPAGAHSGVFLDAGFQIHRRLFMTRPLPGLPATPGLGLPAASELPDGLELRPWRDDDLPSAARLISAAYSGHPDSVVNDQYRSVHGSMRFLNNIVRYSGCGAFFPHISHVVVDRASRELAALVLASKVSAESGHITQICVHPHFRRHGLARILLRLAASGFERQGLREISLTVTEANTEAIALYRAEGYDCVHRFDAAVWQRGRTA